MKTIAVSLRTGRNLSDLAGSPRALASTILASCASHVARTVPIRREPSRHRLVGRRADEFCGRRRNQIRHASLRRPGTSPRRFGVVAPASTTGSMSSKVILAPRRRSHQANSTPWFFCSVRISTAFCPAKTKHAKSNNALGSERLLAYHPPSPLFPSLSPGSACHGLS